MPETYYCSTVRTGKLMKVCQYVYMYNIIIFCLYFLNYIFLIYIKLFILKLCFMDMNKVIFYF